jgi:Fic family protein
MDQKIFTMGLTVEATSLYLLMVSLSDAGTPLTLESCRQFWNSSAEDMQKALTELEQRGVIEKTSTDNWFIQPSANWR